MTRQKEQEGLGRKNKRGDRKGESNDSPEIPDRRETSDTPGLPSALGSLIVVVVVTGFLMSC